MVNCEQLDEQASREYRLARKTGDADPHCGTAPLEATMFEMESLRCNPWGEVFTASEPQSAGPEKFDTTAVVMIALLKYGTGMPFNRMERLEGQLV